GPSGTRSTTACSGDSDVDDDAATPHLVGLLDAEVVPGDRLGRRAGDPDARPLDHAELAGEAALTGAPHVDAHRHDIPRVDCVDDLLQQLHQQLRLGPGLAGELDAVLGRYRADLGEARDQTEGRLG